MNAHTAIIAAEAGLSPLEWQAVAIGFHDADTGAGQPSLLRGLIDKLQGRAAANPLADERLEALRRFGCAARAAQGRVADAVAQPLLDLGISRPQLAMVAACAVAVGTPFSH